MSIGDILMDEFGHQLGYTTYKADQMILALSYMFSMFNDIYSMETYVAKIPRD